MCSIQSRKGHGLLLMCPCINFTHQRIPGPSPQLPIYCFCIDLIHLTSHPFLTLSLNYWKKIETSSQPPRQILIERVNCFNYSSALQTCSLEAQEDSRPSARFSAKHTAEPHPEGSPPPTPSTARSVLCLKTPKLDFTRQNAKTPPWNNLVFSQLPRLPSCAICQVSKNTISFSRIKPHTFAEPLKLPVSTKVVSIAKQTRGN